MELFMKARYLWGNVIFWAFLVISTLLGLLMALFSVIATQKGELVSTFSLMCLTMMIPIGICLTGRWMKHSTTPEYQQKNSINKSIQLFNYSYPIGALFLSPLLGILMVIAFPNSDGSGDIGTAIMFGCITWSISKFHQTEGRKLTKQEFKTFFWNTFPTYIAINILYIPMTYAYILEAGIDITPQRLVPAVLTGLVVALLQFMFFIWLTNIMSSAFKKKNRPVGD